MPSADEVKSRIAGLCDQPASQPPEDSHLAQFLRRLSKGQMVEALHILADEMAE